MTQILPETSLHIEGMTCGACVARVDKALRSVPGVQAAAVNLTTGMAAVKGAVDESQLLTAVDRAGYSARLMAGSSAQMVREVSAEGQMQERAVGRRLLIGILAGVPVLLIDLFHERLVPMHSPRGLAALIAAQLLLATLVMATTGAPFFLGAWRALRHRAANMDLLVALGTGVAYIYSVVLQGLIWFGRLEAHRYHNELHAAVTIVVLVTLGKYLESRAKRRASSAVAGLATQTVATAVRILPDGSMESVSAEHIGIGERLQVLAHQTLPVDGEVVEGSGSADLSVITGESIPVEIQIGTQLPGGAMLADGRIVLRATSTAAASTVARILDLVNAAQASKTQIQGLADRIAAIFVPIVLVLAAGNFTAWMLFTGRWEQALVTTIATIVIACPCAMGLATPTAITVALGTAARLGILFTQANALERAGKIGTVIFDKTGTLTRGTPEVSQVIGQSLVVGDESTDETLRVAASLEQFSEHPLAKAIVAAAQAKTLTLREPDNFNSIAGGGIKGAFAGTGEFAVGSHDFIESLNVAEINHALKFGDLQNNGQSAVLVADIGRQRILGIIRLHDTLRNDAIETLRALRDRGIRVGVLSGDSEAAVRMALNGVEVDFIRARVKPEEKAAVIAQLQHPTTAFKNTQIAFVGDGINDAPALAAADLGIAMAAGTGLAKSAGDVLLTSNRLLAIPQTLALSRRTLRIIKQNLFWAFAYNVAAIPLAMTGVLSPGIAAGAMILSSLTVIANALRLNRLP